MNTILLNTINLDGGAIIKKGGGGIPIHNQDKVVDITENGTTEVVADDGYTGLGKVTINTEVEGGGEGAKPQYTGHADAEGLRAIGWTDEDIAYYQATGVNWNEEDDEYHKVTDDNKALYGELTASNISSYKDRIVYLPKIDTSGVTSMENFFQKCFAMVAIPKLDTSNVTNMNGIFKECHLLTSIPSMDTSNVTNMNNMFYKCYSLTSLPSMDTSNVMYMGDTFSFCHSLTSLPSMDTSNVISMNTIVANCTALTTIPMLDISNAWEYMTGSFNFCVSLTNFNFKGVKKNFELKYAQLMTKDSLLYLINNEVSSGRIIITLAGYAYIRLATDPDIVAALANHPNISLAK